MTREKILVVDDDENVVRLIQHGLAPTIDVIGMTSVMQGLWALKGDDPYSVIVTDLHMPEMDGDEFLKNAKTISPSSTGVIMTGDHDIRRAVKAIEEGSVFRFLLKPFSIESLQRTIAAAIEQTRLLTAEKNLLEVTVQRTIKLLADLLGLAHPIAQQRANRILPIVCSIAKILNVAEFWQVEVACMLSQIGAVAIPEGILQKAYRQHPLEDWEARTIKKLPQIGSELVGHIPRLEPVARIIAYQSKHYDGSGEPDDEVRGEAIPMASRIINACLEFDSYRTAGDSDQAALARMEAGAVKYDPLVLNALESLAGQHAHGAKQSKGRSIAMSDLRTGMALAQDVINQHGVPLLTRGHVVTSLSLQRLMALAFEKKIDESVCVDSPSKS